MGVVEGRGRRSAFSRPRERRGVAVARGRHHRRPRTGQHRLGLGDQPSSDCLIPLVYRFLSLAIRFVLFSPMAIDAATTAMTVSMTRPIIAARRKRRKRRCSRTSSLASSYLGLP